MVDLTADRLLGAHVRSSAHHDVRPCHPRPSLVLGPRLAPRQFRQTEVQHLDLRGRCNHHVGRLHIAVNDPDGVRCLQCFRDLAADGDDVARRQVPSTQMLGQRSTLDMFHRDEVMTVALAGVVDDRDIGMCER